MRRSALAATLAAAIIFGAATACGGGSGGGGGGSSTNAEAPATFSARFDTTKGAFVVTVHRDWAPLGADRFYELVRDHFYDNEPIFRVAPGFVVQWGISGDPSVAKKWQTKTLKDDLSTGHSNVQGTVTFAIGGVDSRTTQVFVNLADNSFLDSQGPFTPFGTITSGFSVFSKLYSGYGDLSTPSSPANHQAEMTQNGASWVHQNFPQLDWIKTARLVQ